MSNGTEAHTEVHKAVKVVAREKPSDYVYTETEVKTWEELDERMKNAVYYTPEERTEEEKAQARENIGSAKEYTYTEEVTMLAEADMLPSVYDTNGKILTDSNGNVILRH